MVKRSTAVRPAPAFGKEITRQKPRASLFQKIARALGPGFVTGISDDDPSGIGTYVAAGARFGFGQIWTALFTTPLMFVVQEIAGRIGMVTGRGLAGILKRHYSRPLLYGTVLLLAATNAINIGVDIGAMAAAVQLLIPLHFGLLVVFFALLTMLLEIFVSYKNYVKYLKILTISVLGYILTGFMIQVDWAHVLQATLLPQIQGTREFTLGLVAILGTTISPYLFFWEASEEVEEEIARGRKTLVDRSGASPQEIRGMRIDVVIGSIFSNLVMFFIILTAATIIFPRGLMVETAADAAKVLAPFAGEFASALFAISIVGTGLLAVPVLAASSAYALAEAFGWKNGLYHSWKAAPAFYGIIVISILVGIFVNALGIPPITALFYTAVLNGIIAPVFIVLMLRVSNNAKIMGSWKNTRLVNVLGWFTVACMAAAIIALFLF